MSAYWATFQARGRMLLQYREDMGPADIARVMGVPEGTVKARLFRGRELIKEKLRAAQPC